MIRIASASPSPPGDEETLVAKLRRHWVLLAAAAVLIGALAGAVTLFAIGGVPGLVSLITGQPRPHPFVPKGKVCAECHTSPHKPPLTGACQDCHVALNWHSVAHDHKNRLMDSGAHGNLKCSLCHGILITLPSPKCYACHTTVVHTISEDCSLCHTTDSFTRSHKLPSTHWPLRKAHAPLKCPDCHSVHTRERLYRCGDCHFKHTDKFPLLKGHRYSFCLGCHVVNGPIDNFNTASIKAKDCNGCHRTQHGGLVLCARCHDTTTFSRTTFVHDTVFRLTGAHTKLACAKCHPQNQFAIARGRRCADCHGTAHGGFVDCTRCHTTAAFVPSTFDHSSVFKLTGTHARTACGRCHPNRYWAQVKGTRCYNCHGIPHQGLADCAKCHNTVAFVPSTFVHSRVFKLTGAHARLACAKCHPKRQFAKVKGTTCVACHGVHHGNQTVCDTCHTTTAWSPIKPFTHPSVFPLVGQHLRVACRDCHKRLIFPNTPTRCFSCHADKFHGPTNCEFCHTPVSWKIFTGGG